jgi:hypothetical protein
MTRSAASVRIRFWLLALLLGMGMAGCTGLVYNRLDTLARWYIQDLVSLDDSQRSDLHSWLEGTLQWHRQSELGRYVKFLRELASAAAQPGNAATYRDIEVQVETFGARLIEQAAPDAARLLLSLTPTQLAEFDANLADKARERNEKNLQALADGKWHEKRAKDIAKQLKRWTGSVTKEQQLLIAQQSTRFDSTTSDWLESQARWRKAMFAALTERFTAHQSPAAVEERILDLLRTPESQWTSEYQAKAERNRQQSLAVLASLDKSLTASQRSHLQSELTKLAQQLEAMVVR